MTSSKTVLIFSTFLLLLTTSHLCAQQSQKSALALFESQFELVGETPIHYFYNNDLIGGYMQLNKYKTVYHVKFFNKEHTLIFRADVDRKFLVNLKESANISLTMTPKNPLRQNLFESLVTLGDTDGNPAGVDGWVANAMYDKPNKMKVLLIVGVKLQKDVGLVLSFCHSETVKEWQDTKKLISLLDKALSKQK